VVAVGTKGGDKKGGVVVKGIVLGDGEEEVVLDVFVLGAPDFFTAFVDDGVLVQVVSDGSGIRQGSKEVREEVGFRGNREWEIGEDGSGQGRRGDNGDRGFSNRWWEVFNGDVSEGDSFGNFFELEMDVCILVFEGQGILKLEAYYISLLGGDVCEDMEKVGWGGDDGGWGQGAVGIEVWGRVITSWAGVIPGVVRTIEVVLDDLVGSSDVDLVSVVDLRPISNREGGGGDEGW
jgi:hypothetical protein